jgi:hypothetical protein
MINFDPKYIMQYIQKDKKLQWLFKIAIAITLASVIVASYRSIVTPETEIKIKEEDPKKPPSETNINSPKIQGNGNEVNINSDFNNIDPGDPKDQRPNSADSKHK